MNELNSKVEAFVDSFFAKWRCRMKMTMFIGQTVVHLEEMGFNLTDLEVADILYKIIRDKNFATFGDITNFRFSEIVPREYL